MLRHILKAVVAAIVLVIAIPAIWFVWDKYFADHEIHYHACGEVAPISVPFSVQYGGYKMSCEFKIEKESSYGIDLRYFNNGTVSDSKMVRETAGGNNWGSSAALGGPMDINYWITSLDTGMLIKSGREPAPKIYAGGHNDSLAHITGDLLLVNLSKLS